MTEENRNDDCGVELSSSQMVNKDTPSMGSQTLKRVNGLCTL